MYLVSSRNSCNWQFVFCFEFLSSSWFYLLVCLNSCSLPQVFSLSVFGSLTWSHLSLQAYIYIYIYIYIYTHTHTFHNRLFCCFFAMPFGWCIESWPKDYLYLKIHFDINVLIYNVTCQSGNFGMHFCHKPTFIRLADDICKL